MNIVEAAQITGIISILLLLFVQLYTAITIKAGINLDTRNVVPGLMKVIDTLVALIVWACTYWLFLGVLRAFAFYQLFTTEQLRIISGFTTVIPLVACLCHIALLKKFNRDMEKITKRG